MFLPLKFVFFRFFETRLFQALYFIAMIKLNYVCIPFLVSTLYLRTGFKETNLYLTTTRFHSFYT